MCETGGCGAKIRYNNLVVSGEYIAELVSRLPEFALVIAFLAPFLGGEITVVAVAFFAGQDVFPLWQVILGSFFGMLALDAFWFAVPNSKLAQKLKNWGRNFERYRNIEARIESLSHHNDILILLISKILVGTRILILTYLGIRKMTFATFILYDSVATFIWAIMLGYAGWFAGLGYYTVTQAYDKLMAGGLYVAVVIALLYGLLWLVRRLIVKKQ